MPTYYVQSNIGGGELSPYASVDLYRLTSSATSPASVALPGAEDMLGRRLSFRNVGTFTASLLPSNEYDETPEHPYDTLNGGAELVLEPGGAVTLQAVQTGSSAWGWEAVG